MRTYAIAVVAALIFCSGASAGPLFSAAEQAAWLTASGTDNATGYSEFLKNFPDGTFATLARLRLDEIGTPARDVRDISLPEASAVPARQLQARTIEPQSKPGCVTSPDAACILSEIMGLIEKESDASSRVNDLSELAKAMAAVGDSTNSLKYLQQAASVARSLPQDDQPSDLTTAAAAAGTMGQTKLADELLNEALVGARRIKSGKTDGSGVTDRGRALSRVATQFAQNGKLSDARRIFGEARDLATPLDRVYRASLLKDIAEEQAKSGLLQETFLTLADSLTFTNDMPQISPLGIINSMGRYSGIKGEGMGGIAETLASLGQVEQATTLARSVGPDTLRVGALLDVRDALSEIGIRDLSDLDREILDTARSAAKAKDAWIYARDIGCALVRFGSLSEGLSVARNLFASAVGLPYFGQRRFSDCIATSIGPDEAGDYVLTTRLPSSDPKAKDDFRYAVDTIAEEYAKRGKITAAKEWINKLPESDRTDKYDRAQYYYEESKRKRIDKLAMAKDFKSAIEETKRLQREQDSQLSGIVATAVIANDLNSALDAARLINDDSYKLSAYTSLLRLM